MMPLFSLRTTRETIVMLYTVRIGAYDQEKHDVEADEAAESRKDASMGLLGHEYEAPNGDQGVCQQQ